MPFCGSRYGTLGKVETTARSIILAHKVYLACLSLTTAPIARHCTANGRRQRAYRGLLPMLLTLIDTPNLGIIVHRLTSM